MYEGASRERGRFIRVGTVDGDIQGLVCNLPEKGARRLILHQQGARRVNSFLDNVGYTSTFSPGVSMPAVTTRLDMTKQDMRKGRKTGWPVSGTVNDCQ